MSKYLKQILFILLAIFSLDIMAQQENEKPNSYSDQYLHPKVDPKQDENPYPTARRLYFGGNGFLSLGTFTDIELSPIVGYWLTPRFSPGIGVKYQYLSTTYYGPRISTNVFGATAFADYLVIKNLNKMFEKMKSNVGIMAHIEYECLSLDNAYFGFTDQSPNSRFLQQNFYAGAGIRQPIGENSSFYVLILFNLSGSSEFSSYSSNPVFRIGFTF